jgi:MFS family permease
MDTLAGEGAIRVSIQNIQIQLPDQAARGWFGIIWLVIASFPAALGGGVLHPAVNSMISKSSDKSEVGGMLGVSASMYSAANAIAPLFYGALFQWFGAPVPFMTGGLILLVLWFIAPRVISNPKGDSHS